MNKLTLNIILGAALLYAAGTGSDAQSVISVNLTGSTGSTIGSTETTGAVAATNWNNFVIPVGAYRGYPGNDPITTPIALNDSMGTVSNVTLSAYTSGANGGDSGITGGGTPQAELFDGGLNNNFGSASFTLSGLSGFSSYDVYAYYLSYAFGGTRYATLSDGTTTYYTAGISTFATAFTQSTDSDTPFNTTSGSPSGVPTTAYGNYVVFSGLTGDSQTFTYANNSNNDTLVGFQVVGVNAEVVPEPSTWMMMLGGIGLLVGLRRFRRTATQA